MKTGLLAIMAVLAVSGCNQASFESKPVVVNTPKGKVVCQLYTAERVQWDEAVARPANMSEKDADEICLKKGAENLSLIRAASR